MNLIETVNRLRVTLLNNSRSRESHKIITNYNASRLRALTNRHKVTTVTSSHTSGPWMAVAFAVQ